jgi:hypothetical protein
VTPHTHEAYPGRDCRPCKRNREAFDAACGVFAGALCLTIVPVVPALIWASHALWGTAGFWYSAWLFYLGLPAMVSALVYLVPRPEATE